MAQEARFGANGQVGEHSIGTPLKQVSNDLYRSMNHWFKMLKFSVQGQNLFYVETSNDVGAQNR